ncbi:unnamed protein product, partial [Aphanomyces euteiches]
MCPTADSGGAVPCLLDLHKGTTTNLPQADMLKYSFVNLGITVIEELPPTAQSIDLSFNNIREVSCQIPPSLVLLNLSYNALEPLWIQTPLNVSTLDVSYTLRVLSWIGNVAWGKVLPSLNRLIFRGNRLTRLRLGSDNFPMTPLSELDLGDNANLLVTVDFRVFDRINHADFILTLDAASYGQSLTACGGNASYVRPLRSVKIVHRTQTITYFDSYANKLVYVCCLGCTAPY